MNRHGRGALVTQKSAVSLEDDLLQLHHGILNTHTDNERGHVGDDKCTREVENLVHREKKYTRNLKDNSTDSPTVRPTGLMNETMKKEEKEQEGQKWNNEKKH